MRARLSGAVVSAVIVAGLMSPVSAAAETNTRAVLTATTQDPFQGMSPTNWPDSVAYGSQVTFTAADVNPLGDSVTRTYDFGDSTPQVTSTATVVRHTYAAVPGGGSKRYQVTVTETSPVDGTQQRYTLWETVNPPGPLKLYYPTFGAPKVGSPLTVEFSSVDAQTPFSIASCTVDFGDGTKPASGCWYVPHTYTRSGLYVARVVVTDAAGRQATASHTLSVGPAFVRTRPVTLLNTFYGVGGTKGVITPGRVLRLKVVGHAGVPQGASAVRLSISAAGAGTAGSVTAYPEGSPRPSLPTVLYPAHQAGSSLISLPIGPDGYVDLANLYGRAYLSAEVEGYDTTTPGSNGLEFVPEASLGWPAEWLEVLDTPSGLGHGGRPGKIGPGGTIRFQAVPGPSAPNTEWTYATGLGAPLVEVNVTTYDSTAFSTLNFQGGPGAGPGTAGVYAYAGQRHSATLLLPVAPDGTVTVHNTAGWTDLIVEVEGFYLPNTTIAPVESMVTVKDTPVLDTRTGLGGHHSSVAYGSNVWVKVGGVGGIPAGTTEVALRLTALNVRKGGVIDEDRTYGMALSVADNQPVAGLVYVPVVNGYVELTSYVADSFNLAASVEGYAAS